MSNSPSTGLVSGRIPTQLVARIKEQTDATGESLTAFLIEALQNECDRRSMTKPRPKVDLVEVLGKLQKIHDLTARVETQNRLLLADQGLIKVAIGI